jgi:hypothetical protein
MNAFGPKQGAITATFEQPNGFVYKVAPCPLNSVLVGFQGWAQPVGFVRRECCIRKALEASISHISRMTLLVQAAGRAEQTSQPHVAPLVRQEILLVRQEIPSARPS